MGSGLQVRTRLMTGFATKWIIDLAMANQTIGHQWKVASVQGFRGLDAAMAAPALRCTLIDGGIGRRMSQVRPRLDRTGNHVPYPVELDMFRMGELI